MFALQDSLLSSPRSLSPLTRALRSRRRRHGGYVKPPASDSTKAGGVPTPATATTARTSSSPPPGLRSVAVVTPLEQVRPSRPTVPGLSGDGTADRGGNGERLVRVVWPDGVSRFYTEPAA